MNPVIVPAIVLVAPSLYAEILCASGLPEKVPKIVRQTVRKPFRLIVEIIFVNTVRANRIIRVRRIAQARRPAATRFAIILKASMIVLRIVERKPVVVVTRFAG